MSRYGLLVAGAIAVAIGAFAVWFLTTYERVEKTIDMPLRGKARFNPLLALERTLRERGMTVKTRSNLHVPTLNLQPDDALVIAADSRTLPEEHVEMLLDWIDVGGDLVVALPPGAEDKTGDLLDALGVTAETGYDCVRFALGAKDLAAAKKEGQGGGEAKDKGDDKAADEDDGPARGRACFNQRFVVDTDVSGELDWTFGVDDEGFVFARQYRGDGSWLVAADLDFLTNAELDEPGNAALAWQVLAPALEAKRIHLVYAADVPPWYVLLVRNGWAVLVPALAALLFWLWSRSQRLGPVLPLAAPHRRALLEHIQATGDFVFRRGRAIALYTALRRAFIARLRRRDPALGALDGEPLVQTLAERLKRPAADVRQALHPVDITKPERFLASIRTLLEMRKDL